MGKGEGSRAKYKVAGMVVGCPMLNKSIVYVAPHPGARRKFVWVAGKYCQISATQVTRLFRASTRLK